VHQSRVEALIISKLKKPLGLALALASFVIARMMIPRDSFAGKVVVITGGSRGLGLALARRLTQENAKLAILARDQQELAPYCVSKFALVGLSDALRAELSSKNISITTVMPGLMRTGSHKNAFFKGQHGKEFAWFSMGAGNPLISMDADRAAGQILDAARRGQPELTITLAARLAAIAQALLPNVTADLMKLTARLLPRMPIRPDNKTYTGWESESTLSPSLLTRMADRATEFYNGLRRFSSRG
jgi:hypothetical protein